MKISEVVLIPFDFPYCTWKFTIDWMLSFFLFARMHISALYNRVVYRLIHGAESI